MDRLGDEASWSTVKSSPGSSLPSPSGPGKSISARSPATAAVSRCRRVTWPEGTLPDLEGTAPRNSLQVFLNREHFSGAEDGYQRVERDYCDTCLPGIWKDIMHILRYDSDRL